MLPPEPAHLVPPPHNSPKRHADKAQEGCQLSIILEDSTEKSKRKGSNLSNLSSLAAASATNKQLTTDVSESRAIVEHTRSGYVADRSTTSTNIDTTHTRTAAAKDDSFDPDKLSAMLMNMSDGQASPQYLQVTVC